MRAAPESAVTSAGTLGERRAVQQHARTMLATTILALTLSSTATAAAPADDGALRLELPWTERSGEGLSFAYDNGAWGGGFSQSVRVTVPFGDHWAADLRGLVVYASAPSFADRMDLGARLELIGRSAVLLNVLRLYGGGGVQLFGAVRGGAAGAGVSVGGGGHFGFEVFLGPNMAWIIEVGGQSGLGEGVGAGATIVAGLQFYPF